MQVVTGSHVSAGSLVRCGLRTGRLTLGDRDHLFPALRCGLLREQHQISTGKLKHQYRQRGFARGWQPAQALCTGRRRSPQCEITTVIGRLHRSPTSIARKMMVPGACGSYSAWIRQCPARTFHRHAPWREGARFCRLRAGMLAKVPCSSSRWMAPSTRRTRVVPQCPRQRLLANPHPRHGRQWIGQAELAMCCATQPVSIRVVSRRDRGHRRER